MSAYKTGWRGAASAAAVWLLPALLLGSLVPAHAGSIDITRAGNRVTVKAQAAKLDEVLERIGTDYKFDVDRVSGRATTPVSGTFSGTVDEIVSRLLVNDAHVIVRDPSKPAGIARILILKSRGPSNGIVTMVPGMSLDADDSAEQPGPARRQPAAPGRSPNPRAFQPPPINRTAPMPPRRILPPGMAPAKTSRLNER